MVSSARALLGLGKLKPVKSFMPSLFGVIQETSGPIFGGWVLTSVVASGVSGQIDIDAMRRLRLVRSKTKPVKVLGDGAIDRALVVLAHAFSRTAEEKIAAAGGRCEKVPLAAAAVSPARG